MNPFLYNPVATVQPPPCGTASGAPSVPGIPGTPGTPGRTGTPGTPGAPAARRGRWPTALGRLALAAGLALAVLPAHAMDVNSASVDQLRTIRGVGPKTAETIVKERERGGRFESMEDLSDRVRGIGPRKAQALQAAGLSVGPGTGAPGARPGAGQGAGAAAGVRPAPGVVSGGRTAKEGPAARSPQRGPR
ncbi:hypothetical protein CAL26_18585 [Bordetella genomosp. 9]|uniref:Helix-hairpin-helix DNA-binding motif class 1 domain-containing protein n=1 Tax=Bordetella genomosp. 9 TaxID=1416803 RepID=A0A261R8U3_9BORD|nr:helix-hairpin-helix domain-containing protein [Bordetella genomosp. 9]OZI21426.1 hypothetical protein CAL26_18585 [Bordetella genomosp. 9]